jgi:hypothetical protein
VNFAAVRDETMRRPRLPEAPITITSLISCDMMICSRSRLFWYKIGILLESKEITVRWNRKLKYCFVDRGKYAMNDQYSCVIHLVQEWLTIAVYNNLDLS